MTATKAKNAPRWRNRIVRARVMVSPKKLLANPLNWRAHPDYQKQFMEGSLDEIGWIDSVTVQDDTDLILNGHMRVALAILRDEPHVPVDYVDLTDAEAKIALAVLDQIPAYAKTDTAKLDALYSGMQSANAQLGALFGNFADYSGLYRANQDSARALLSGDAGADHAGNGSGAGYHFPPPEPGDIPAPGAQPGYIAGADLPDAAPMPEHDESPTAPELDDSEPTGRSDGSLLALVDVTIADPTHKPATGDVWKLGRHTLIVANVFKDWPLWSAHLTDPAIVFVPYPGPFVPLSILAEKSPLVMVQPDTYVAGHMLDHWQAVTGAAPEVAR